MGLLDESRDAGTKSGSGIGIYSTGGRQKIQSLPLLSQIYRALVDISFRSQTMLNPSILDKWSIVDEKVCASESSADFIPRLAVPPSLKYPGPAIPQLPGKSRAFSQSYASVQRSDSPRACASSSTSLPLLPVYHPTLWMVLGLILRCRRRFTLTLAWQRKGVGETSLGVGAPSSLFTYSLAGGSWLKDKPMEDWARLARS